MAIINNDNLEEEIPEDDYPEDEIPTAEFEVGDTVQVIRAENDREERGYRNGAQNDINVYYEKIYGVSDLIGKVTSREFDETHHEWYYKIGDHMGYIAEYALLSSFDTKELRQKLDDVAKEVRLNPRKQVTYMNKTKNIFKKMNEFTEKFNENYRYSTKDFDTVDNYLNKIIKSK